MHPWTSASWLPGGGCAGGRLHPPNGSGIDGAVVAIRNRPGASRARAGWPHRLEVSHQSARDIGVWKGPRRHPAAEAPVQIAALCPDEHQPFAARRRQSAVTIGVTQARSDRVISRSRSSRAFLMRWAIFDLARLARGEVGDIKAVSQPRLLSSGGCARIAFGSRCCCVVAVPWSCISRSAAARALGVRRRAPVTGIADSSGGLFLRPPLRVRRVRTTWPSPLATRACGPPRPPDSSHHRPSSSSVHQPAAGAEVFEEPVRA